MMLNSLMMKDSWSPVMHEMVTFHDHAMVVILAICSMVFMVFIMVMSSKEFVRSINSEEGLEIVWTVLPCFVLVSLAFPSLMTLYLSDEMVSPVMTVKVIGHQWYWSYEWSDFWGVEFDSFMKSTSDLISGEMRLLEVDERMVVPMNQEVRLVVTSSDVIHSWSLPSAGVKVDAIPGRINQLTLYLTRVGVMYGQCSEICGSLHSFMPICLEVVGEEEFVKILEG